MFQLLIVDDEATIVNRLADDIDWELLEISGIRKAFTGKQALEQIRAQRVDIVIADIKMPGLDGLELTEIIRSQWPHVKVILISGYDDFQYAQKALDLGVFSFVTKPFSYKELRDTVERAVFKIHDDMEKSRIIDQSTAYLHEHLEILQERFLIQLLILGKVNPLESTEMLKRLHIGLDSRLPAFMLMLRFDNRPMQDKNNDWAVDAEIINLAMELLFRNRDVLFFRDLEGNGIFILQDEWGELSKHYRYIQEMAEIFQNAADHIHSLVSIFVENIVPSISELHCSYRKLLEMSHRFLVWNTGMIVGPEILPETAHNQALTSLHDLPTFGLLIDSYQKETVIQRIEAVFREFEDKKNEVKDKVLDIYFTVAQALIQSSNRRGLQLESWAGNELPHFYNFEGLKSVYNLKSWCIHAVTLFIDSMLRHEMHHGHYIVEQLKKRLSSDYMNGFSLIERANHLRIHPNYLSRLFKKETGMSITDYLIRIRMEKAKELLAQPGIKVYEIAELVGYESIAHFNRTFKRYTGKNPKEYKNLSFSI